MTGRAVQRVVAGVLTATLAALAGALFAGLAKVPDKATVLTDLDGRRVTLDVEPDVEGADLVPLDVRLTVPAVALDVPLVEMPITRGVLNPPTLTDAFLVRHTDAATPREDGKARPRVVALHAVQGGRAAGNALTAIDGGEVVIAVGAGDAVHVGDDEHVVVGVELIRKEDAAEAASVWAPADDGADRLVIITCLPRQGGPSRASHNIVIHARRSP